MHSDLIARIESGDGDERELDAEVGRVVFGPDAVRNGGVGWPFGTMIVPCYPGWMELPRYMTSVDAALTLLPEGWWLAFLGWNDARDAATAVIESFCANHDGQGRAPTPARAITAACLRALRQKP